MVSIIWSFLWSIFFSLLYPRTGIGNKEIFFLPLVGHHLCKKWPEMKISFTILIQENVWVSVFNGQLLLLSIFFTFITGCVSVLIVHYYSLLMVTLSSCISLFWFLFFFFSFFYSLCLLPYPLAGHSLAIRIYVTSLRIG